MDLMNVPAKFEVRSFTRSWDNSEYWKNCAVPGYAVQGHPRWPILIPIECAYMTSYIIVTLVLSCTVSEILQVFCAPEWPHPYSTPVLGVFPLHQIAHVGVSPGAEALSYSAVKLFSKNSNLCHYVITVRKRYRRTDSRTDGRTDNIRSQYHALH